MASSRIADSVGRVLGDRYRLTRPLGVGASAHVYVAEDVNLRRRVAIKVLHPALAADEAFLRRFRAEARVVAGLNHPNILTVFDWGEDGGAPYLVMELLEGGSLRALLDRGELLSPAQAAAVGADAARALDYAHRRGLVHRDIKPANLIFDHEGRLTVADFGLARALAEATWTEPAGAVVGTARYAAPEQVRGESLGSPADVYSLALVLIEATTGIVPFAADTTLATLMARLEQPVRMPIDVGPLGAVLEAAGTIDPADRLDAIGLARALDGVAAKLPLPDPLPLAGSAVRGEAEQDNSPTDYPGRPRLFDGEQADVDGSRATATPAGGGLLDSSATSDRKSTSEVVNRPEVTATVKGPAGDSDRSGRTGRRRWRWVALVVGLLVLLGGATAGALVAAGAFEPSHVVPHLIGDTQAEAAGLLRPLHLHLVVSGRVYDAQAPAGTVISQRPETGRLEEGRPVDATLSLGPAPVAVPARLTGLSESAAAAVLETLSLRPGAVTHASSMTVLAGDVISSTPNSGTLLPGQTVALVISTGKPTVAIPTLSGASLASFAAAQSALGAVQLVATENQAYSFTVAAGHVIGISPPAGTKAIVGSQVTVNISKGPHVVAVPDVEDDSVGAASQALSAAGFEVSGVTGNPIATVTGTSPGGGVMADYGSSVQIITS